jgi:hypothetical protein
MIGAQVQPVDGAAPVRSARRAGGAALALTVFAAGLAVAGVGIGTAAYWVDEATTVMLVHWRWADLLQAIRGPEVPLGPYYLLMYPWTSVNAAEWWVRLPSALAMAGAVALVTAWIRRRLGTASALAGAGVILALPAFSRYAQEARPYGLMVLAVTCCTLAWWRWCERGGRAAATWYALGVAVLPLCHALALTVVPAQVLAALLGAAPSRATAGRSAAHAPGPRRLGPAVRTGLVAGLAVVVVLPYLWLVRQKAMGVAYPLPLTWTNAWTTFTASLAGPPRAGWLTDRLGAAVVALAGVGLLELVRPGDRQRGRMLGFLACWALVPPLLLCLAAVGDKTLVPRYFMVSLPAWGLLAGHGCALVGRGLAAALRAVRLPHPVPTGLAVLVGTLPVVTLAIAGMAHQTHYRTASGHGNGDVRPAIALLRTAAYRDLPVVMAPDEYWWILVAEAYDPGLPHRDPLATDRLLDEKLHVDLREVTGPDALRRLSGVNAVALLARTGDPDTALRTLAGVEALRGFRTVSVNSYDGWSVVLARRSGPS